VPALAAQHARTHGATNSRRVNKEKTMACVDIAMMLGSKPRLEYIDYFEFIERVRTQLLSPWVLGELKA
jgi:hypothetical protein